MAPGLLRRGLVDARTWGNARQLAQVEVAPVRVELLPSSRVDGAQPTALHGVAELALARRRPVGGLVFLVSCDD